LDERELSRAIEGVEQASTRSLYASAPAAVAAATGIRHKQIAGADCFAVTGSRHGCLNRVVGLGMRQPATDRVVDRIVSWYRARGAHRVGIEVTPHARPGNLVEGLVERGFESTGETAKLWRCADPVSRTPGDLPVRRVGEARADDWFEVMAKVFRHYRNRGGWFTARFGRGGWSFYAAFDDDRIVGIGALFVRDGVGHLVDAATLPEYRRQGVQRRIVEARVRRGLHEGARLFTSETAPPQPRTPLISFRNLCRVGFELAYVRQGYRLELD